jgi:hypothetical protein
VFRRVSRQTNRCRQLHAAGFRIVVRGVDGFEHALCNLLGDVSICPWQHDHELLATEASDQVAASDTTLQRQSTAAQYAIPGRRPEPFVDVLEVIDVDVGDTQVASEDDGLRELAIEQPVEPRAVQDAGECIATARVLGFLRTREQDAGRRLEVAHFLQGLQLADRKQLAGFREQVFGIFG